MLQVLSSSHAGALAFSNNGSLAALASLLGRTHNPHTLEKITGTLWNLSRHEFLRAALVELCLPALVEHVLVPESGWRSNFGDSPASPSPPGSSASPSAAFCNALTCLRELSSADPDGRLSTWKGEGLVDCVLRFVRSALRGRNIETKVTPTARWVAVV
ncbi:catenin delta-2-like [Lethenteron reissneri]|uniref:catenin delta-2-like n=1 Tax=Lethenteron reissneri TaxID=7753 RepID=UPI002AB6BC4C|nr:catenin delta-2-like [Lethenteron reissneri]